MHAYIHSLQFPSLHIRTILMHTHTQHTYIHTLQFPSLQIRTMLINQDLHNIHIYIHADQDDADKSGPAQHVRAKCIMLAGRLHQMRKEDSMRARELRAAQVCKRAARMEHCCMFPTQSCINAYTHAYIYIYIYIYVYIYTCSLLQVSL